MSFVFWRNVTFFCEVEEVEGEVEDVALLWVEWLGEAVGEAGGSNWVAPVFSLVQKTRPNGPDVFDTDHGEDLEREVMN